MKTPSSLPIHEVFTVAQAFERKLVTVAAVQIANRLGLNVPYEWWSSSSLLKSFEAAGFGWTQIPAPPEAVLADPSECRAHSRAVATALANTGLQSVIHGPGSMVAGSAGADRIFEGLLDYAAEAGARQVIYHARNCPDSPGSEDRLLAETRSLARLAARAESLGISIALENLAPLLAGPERLGHTPRVLRTLAQRISSPAVGLCIDVGHAYIAADLRHADVVDLVGPALDAAICFHAHDNFGARRSHATRPELDPMRLDLHLPPGRGDLPWDRLSPLIAEHDAPVLLEIHPPHRPDPSVLHEQTIDVMGARATQLAA